MVETLQLPDWINQQFLFLAAWQWLGLFASILLGLILKAVVQRIHYFTKRLTERTRNEWDDKIVLALEKPAGWIAMALLWFFLLEILHLEGKTYLILSKSIQIIFGIGLIWTLYRLADVASDYLGAMAAKTDTLMDDQMVPLIRKALRIFVIVFGALLVVQNLGVNVMSVFAGLGLGGLAFALAAKDTCANLFGSIMIMLDRPFNVGDWIVANGQEGTVEEIGFRSTRIRTFYNSVVSVPNSMVANVAIDNMGRRRYRRVKAFFGLTYDTPSEKVKEFIAGIKEIVEKNKYTRKDYYHVVFNEYGDFSLNVLLYCFLSTPDWATELKEKENLYLEVLDLAQRIGVEFAFPTQTMHLESVPSNLIWSKPAAKV